MEIDSACDVLCVESNRILTGRLHHIDQGPNLPPQNIEYFQRYVRSFYNAVPDVCRRIK